VECVWKHLFGIDKGVCDIFITHTQDTHTNFRLNKQHLAGKIVSFSLGGSCDGKKIYGKIFCGYFFDDGDDEVKLACPNDLRFRQ
jgi:hypothetical protein